MIKLRWELPLYVAGCCYRWVRALSLSLLKFPFWWRTPPILNRRFFILLRSNVMRFLLFGALPLCVRCGRNINVTCNYFIHDLMHNDQKNDSDVFSSCAHNTLFVEICVWYCLEKLIVCIYRAVTAWLWEKFLT